MGGKKRNAAAGRVIASLQVKPREGEGKNVVEAVDGTEGNEEVEHSVGTWEDETEETGKREGAHVGK